MTYGAQVLSPAGASLASTADGIPAVSAGVVVVPAGSSPVTQSFPGHEGRTGMVISNGGLIGPDLLVSWSYPAGTPTVTLSRTSTPLSSTLPIAAFIVLQ